LRYTLILRIMEIKELIEKASDYLPSGKVARVAEAYQFALDSYQGQVEKLQPALGAAMILAQLQLDADCLAAALLHGLPEDCEVSLAQIESISGAKVRGLVDNVNKLGRLSWQAPSESQAESLRKMFLAMAQDLRVVFIKLADRLEEMRALKAVSSRKRQALAKETMEVYAPLAHRLGIWQLKWELEDLSFRYLQPRRYRQIAHLIAARRADREKYIAQVTRILEHELQKVAIAAEITGRPKNIYSIHTKMEDYEAQGKEFSDIQDLLAVRVLVDQVQDCYSALGVIHSLWRPLPGRFDDYIANPKGNMYQSLHTTVMALEARPLEIQIRTRDMHRIAEYGIAAHWRYKEGTKRDMHFEHKMAWLRQLMAWQQELSGTAFVESVKTDIFQDQVYVFTPKGEIKELPRGASPLDFAYRIHTDLGHRCIGAKVNGRLVSLDYQLQNGDAVEILCAKTERAPSLDWLNPDLGYVKTRHAQEKIRQWFRKQERVENIKRGQELLDKELRRLGLSSLEQERIAALFGYEEGNDFLAAIGCGDVNLHQLRSKLTAQEERPQPSVTAPRQPRLSSAIQVLGVGDLLTRLAPCCNPIPGDDIIGFVTRMRGVTIHRKDCPNIINEDEKERLVPVSWGADDRSYPVPIQVEAWDRMGLLKDISTIVSAEKVNIATISSAEHGDGITSISLTLEITGIGQLSRLFSRLEGIRGVIGVTRGGGDEAGKT
jgi:guanosine-3',5'-bis(diphosphate) 3'-pyrophosphohydrolase